MIVVADTGPLNYLIQIGYIDVLQIRYDRVLIPEVVLEELSHPRSPLGVRIWAAELPGWCELVKIDREPHLSLARLDAGERAAIQLALDHHVATILIDEFEGRQLAARHGLIVRGTLGVLKEASLDGLLNLRSAVSMLLKTNFIISQRILDQILNTE